MNPIKNIGISIIGISQDIASKLTYFLKQNPVTNAKELVDQADKALYYSKRTGRNKVSFADEQVIAEIDRENQQ